MIKIFVIDDHFLIGDGFKEAFIEDSDGILISGFAKNVPIALSKIDPSKTDVIILDLFIHFEDPVINIRTLTKEFPLLPIVILSYESSLAYQVLMFREGAKAFVSKSDDKEKLLEVLRYVAKGYTLMPNEISRYCNGPNQKQIRPILKPLEKEIVDCLANGAIIKEIAKRVNKTPSLVEKKLSALRERFKAKTNCELVSILQKLDSTLNY